MPRKRKSDPSLYAWDEENMKTAVMAHLKDGMPIRTAATLHAVQKSTLSRYCKAYSASADEEKAAFRFTPRYDVKKVFSSEMEDSLESYFLLSSRMNYGLTKKRTKKLAWEFAKANTLKYPKSWDGNEAAGEDWYKGFMERHTRISLRRPESTSLHRNLGFNRAAVDTFYKHLEELQSKFHFPADRIYNMDETGLSNVQQKCRKVLSPKGVKQLGATTSQERGKLVTMVGTINAMGSFIPPYLIFGRTRFVERLLDGAPPGTKAVASGKPGNAWMTTELFLGYFEHFKRCVRCSPKQPVLLLMDNHDSHMSYSFISAAKEMGLQILTFPPHTSNRLQTLDVTVYSPLKTYFYQAIENWLRNHPGRPVTEYEISELLGVAFPKAFNPTNIMSLFF
ncbi:uncharacterized protein LOC136025761 [Artemia franciscana]|uniref:uncharacterized protein LOC136025761 n=1 Tax=Artemia franciscana TaxID=6661 RepID=UPI0032DABD6E